MRAILRTACVAGIFCGALWAQAPVASEPLSAWPYFKELHPRTGMAEFVLDRDVLANARQDQADLRLYDGSGREIPYALRIRRDVDNHSLFTGREFNRAVEGGATLISCDLGPQPQEHNEVVIATSGNNFRRLADVQGSADGSQWVALTTQAILFRFSAEGRSAEQQSVSYPVSRYRYVRVRLERDPQVEHAPPEITSIAVRRSMRAKGETVTFNGDLESREADPVRGRPASIWHIDLGSRIPVQALTLAIAERTFSRPFSLEIVDDPSAPVVLASGELKSREETAGSPTQIDFTEQFARRLKLTVTDDRNPPLSLLGVNALSAMRQVIFPAASGVVRLYYGNLKGIAPHYDVAAAMRVETGGARVQLGPERGNPIYHPEPKPLSERLPWAVYLVLTGACVALAAILLNLARTAPLQKQTPAEP